MASRMMKTFCTSLLFGAKLVDGSIFLGKSAENAGSGSFSLEIQHKLLNELEGLLGGEHKSFTERRLKRIEDGLKPIFAALPKNEHGKLCHAGASYALHRLFVQRHGWSVKGLQSEDRALAAWNSSSPTGLFGAKDGSDHVAGAFEKRVAETGLSLQELAVLAATLEHLVHKEAMSRLHTAYSAHNTTAEDVVSIPEATEIMDSYMVVYILGFMLQNPTNATPAEVQKLRSVVDEVYPTWSGTQEFMREVRDSVAPKRDYLYFSDVATVIEEAGERYGKWQDKECRDLKDELLKVEDKSPGGAGRVRIADFYKLAIHEGKSQFSESLTFLRQQGALDESDPANPRVLITNYISSPSNCVASSSFFSVCCVDECEDIFQQLEKRIAAPDASPYEILSLVAATPSHTMPKHRALSPWLQQKLRDIATHHGGRVPLHGRLFTQWMHFAYPRECSYPHVSGSMEHQRPEEVFSAESIESLQATASEDEMKKHIETFNNQTSSKPADAEEEFEMWTMEEELVVTRPTLPSDSQNKGSGAASFLRGAAFVAALTCALSALAKQVRGAKQAVDTSASSKYYV